MKRILLVLFAVLVIGGGFFAWWMLRDSPGKALVDAAASFAGFTSAESISAEVAVTDLGARNTTGFSVVGSIDASDLTHLQGIGEVRIGSKTVSGQDETVDVVLNTKSVLLRPADVTPEHLALYQSLVGNASGTTLLLFDRAAFLEKFGYKEAVAGGTSKDIRATLQSLMPTILPAGTMTTAQADGYTAVTVPFTLDQAALRPFLIALVKSWTGHASTPDEYAWVERIVEDLGRGNFAVSIDASKRDIRTLSGEFPLMDAAGNETRRVRFTLEFGEVGQAVSIPTPKDVKDVTSSIHATVQNTFQGSEIRVAPVSTSTPAVMPPGSRQVQIDMFSKYQEAIKKKKNLY